VAAHGARADFWCRALDLRYSLPLRDVEELLAERGLAADHATLWRWVRRYGPELEQRLRRHLKPTNKSWHVDETRIRVKGRRCYLYRAVDSTYSRN
jgi:transposase-like protein